MRDCSLLKILRKMRNVYASDIVDVLRYDEDEKVHIRIESFIFSDKLCKLRLYKNDFDVVYQVTMDLEKPINFMLDEKLSKDVSDEEKVRDLFYKVLKSNKEVIEESFENTKMSIRHEEESLNQEIRNIIDFRKESFIKEFKDINNKYQKLEIPTKYKFVNIPKTNILQVTDFKTFDIKINLFNRKVESKILGKGDVFIPKVTKYLQKDFSRRYNVLKNVNNETLFDFIEKKRYLENYIKVFFEVFSWNYFVKEADENILKVKAYDDYKYIEIEEDAYNRYVLTFLNKGKTMFRLYNGYNEIKLEKATFQHLDKDLKNGRIWENKNIEALTKEYEESVSYIQKIMDEEDERRNK